MLGARQGGTPAQEQMQAAGGEPAMQDGAQQQASPEEQAQYDALVGNAQTMIYGDDNRGNPAVLDNLKGNFAPEFMQMFAGAEPPVQQNPVDSLAVTCVALILFLDASSAQAGVQIEDDVLYHGGSEILSTLADTSEAAGIHDYSEKDVETAFYRSLDLFRVSSPRVDQEALAAEFEAMHGQGGAGPAPMTQGG